MKMQCVFCEVRTNFFVLFVRRSSGSGVYEDACAFGTLRLEVLAVVSMKMPVLLGRYALRFLRNRAELLPKCTS